MYESKLTLDEILEATELILLRSHYQLAEEIANGNSQEMYLLTKVQEYLEATIDSLQDAIIDNTLAELANTDDYFWDDFDLTLEDEDDENDFSLRLSKYDDDDDEF